ncbi:hypothetical protein Zm00014a_041619 [Zea mays]|uniref:Uncharacterized protein n=1 Tax=Zea mays TaxID=4577 RepID=A0A317YF82_MAIZE|nr:hypothetical protein Zm00014a_041619 [Zea mays]
MLKGFFSCHSAYNVIHHSFLLWGISFNIVSVHLALEISKGGPDVAVRAVSATRFQTQLPTVNKLLRYP